MDPSDSACTNISDNNNLVATEAQFQPQNPIHASTGLSENTSIADKSELKKILDTVSLLSASKVCDNKPLENVKPRSNNKRKISECQLSSDDDEIEIIDVVVYKNPRENSANEISVMSAYTPTQMCSNSSSDNLTVADVLTVKDENISDVEMTSEEVLENDSCEVSVAEHADSVKKESVSVGILETDSVSMSNTTKKVGIKSNSPKTCTVKDTIETIEIKENEIPSDSAMSDEIVDLSNCPETCNGKDTTETIKIKENKIPSDSAMSDEIVDLSNCPETCNGKDTTETTKIKEKEIPSDSAVSNETVDPTNETFEYSNYDIEYDFNDIPVQITGSFKEFNAGKKNNFTRGCKWAPDGSCILTCNDDNKLRIFNLPSQLWDTSQWCDISELEAVLKISEGDLIYDYCWYPLMNSNDVSTCCLVSTSRKSTVHLWDAYTGELRCSYRSFNHMDELVTPHSLSFDSGGEKLFCGFRNAIRVFDVNRPGREFEERLTYSHKTGQGGIISCFAFTSADKNISAAGSYKSTIGLYAEPDGELTCLLEGQANGITQLKFSPDGQYLYSGGRKDSEILCWDLRNLGTVLFSLRRSCETNQRIYFDISKCGKYVASGNHNGVITFWDVTKEPKIINEDDFPVLIPVHFFLAHNDCVNGISFHPSYPLLCSSSGQRKFPVLMNDDSDAVFSSELEKQDNSLRLWWIGK